MSNPIFPDDFLINEKIRRAQQDFLLEKMARESLQIILDRTSRGIGLEGPFREYADRTARRKGYNAPRNLNEYGNMLSSIVYVEKGGQQQGHALTMTAGFEQLKALWQQFGTKGPSGKPHIPPSPFFGLTDTELTSVCPNTAQAYNRVFKRRDAKFRISFSF